MRGRCFLNPSKENNVVGVTQAVDILLDDQNRRFKNCRSELTGVLPVSCWIIQG